MNQPDMKFRVSGNNLSPNLIKDLLDVQTYQMHVFVSQENFKGTNPALKKPSNIPEIYAKMLGRFH